MKYKKSKKLEEKKEKVSESQINKILKELDVTESELLAQVKNERAE
jgi:hypothetical protein